MLVTGCLCRFQKTVSIVGLCRIAMHMPTTHVLFCLRLSRKLKGPDSRCIKTTNWHLQLLSFQQEAVVKDHSVLLLFFLYPCHSLIHSLIPSFIFKMNHPVKLIGLEDLDAILNASSDEDSSSCYSSSYCSFDDDDIDSESLSIDSNNSDAGNSREQKMVDELKEKARQRRLNRKAVGPSKDCSYEFSEDGDSTTENNSCSNKDDDDSANLDDSVHLPRNSEHRRVYDSLLFEQEESSDFGDEEGEEVVLILDLGEEVEETSAPKKSSRPPVVAPASTSLPRPVAQEPKVQLAKSVQLVGLDDLDELLNQDLDDFSSSYDSEADDSSFDSSYCSSEEEDDDISLAEKIPSESFREQKMVDELKEKARQRRLRRKAGGAAVVTKKIDDEESTADTSVESDDVNDDDSVNLNDSIHLATKNSGHRIRGLSDHESSHPDDEDDGFSDFGEEDEEELPMDWKAESSESSFAATSEPGICPISRKNNLATTAA